MDRIEPVTTESKHLRCHDSVLIGALSLLFYFSEY